MTQKETLWTNVYIETIKEFSPIKAESAATQAVEAFEKRFDKELNKIENILNSGNKVTFTPFDKDMLLHMKMIKASEVHKSTSSSFTQAERLKSLFEELGIAVECGNDEDDSFIMVLDWVFYFKNGAFKNVKVI